MGSVVGFNLLILKPCRRSCNGKKKGDYARLSGIHVHNIVTCHGISNCRIKTTTWFKSPERNATLQDGICCIRQVYLFSVNFYYNDL